MTPEEFPDLRGSRSVSETNEKPSPSKRWVCKILLVNCKKTNQLIKFTITKKEKWYALSSDTERSSDKIQHPLQIVKKTSLWVWRKGSPPTSVVGKQLGAAPVENRVGILRKLKTELPSDPASPHLGVSRKDRSSHLERCLCPQCSQKPCSQ